MMSKWADELVQQRRTQEQQLRADSDARITDRKRIQANAEAMYHNIRTLINGLVAELNEASESHAINAVNVNSNQIEVSSGNSTAKVQFVPRDQMLHVSFYGGDLNLSVNSDDKLVWQSSAESRKSWTDEQVARLTVEYAWRGGNPLSR